jgi:hypothetical protein
LTNSCPSYVQFHPLAYIVKLNIELSMADLISKIVRSQDRVDNSDSNSHPTELTSNPRSRQFDSKIGTFSFPNKVSNVCASKVFSGGYPEGGDIGAHNQGGGIMKTIATVIETVDKGDRESVSSSTRQLNQ